MKLRLLLVTTVPETMATILKGQPRYLSQYFPVSLATTPGKGLKEVIGNEGLEVFKVPMTRGIHPLNDFLSILRMISVLRKVKPILVHSYTPKAGLVSMLAGLLCGIPIRVHTFTGLIFPTSSGLKRHLLILIDKLICACATKVVPEGEGVKRDLQDFGVTKKALEVIGYGNIAGVDTRHFSPAADDVRDSAIRLRKVLSISDSDFVFCFVGRLNKDKGLLELVSAFFDLPATAHLLLVGDLDESAPVSVATLTDIRNNPRIHKLGFLCDIRPALGAADVMVLPSYREGFPNSVLQAGAMELPTIATDINGCNEVIKSGYNGWLVPPRDARALANSMKCAMKISDSDRKKMGLCARSRIQERFEQHQHWDLMRDFYRVLLSEKGYALD